MTWRMVTDTTDEPEPKVTAGFLHDRVRALESACAYAIDSLAGGNVAWAERALLSLRWEACQVVDLAEQFVGSPVSAVQLFDQLPRSETLGLPTPGSSVREPRRGWAAFRHGEAAGPGCVDEGECLGSAERQAPLGGAFADDASSRAGALDAAVAALRKKAQDVRVQLDDVLGDVVALLEDVHHSEQQLLSEGDLGLEGSDAALHGGDLVSGGRLGNAKASHDSPAGSGRPGPAVIDDHLPAEVGASEGSATPVTRGPERQPVVEPGYRLRQESLLSYDGEEGSSDVTKLSFGVRSDLVRVFAYLLDQLADLGVVVHLAHEDSPSVSAQVLDTPDASHGTVGEPTDSAPSSPSAAASAGGGSAGEATPPASPAVSSEDLDVIELALRLVTGRLRGYVSPTFAATADAALERLRSSP